MAQNSAMASMSDKHSADEAFSERPNLKLPRLIILGRVFMQATGD
jgi:hypothetical protein